MDSHIFHIKKIVLLTWSLNVRCASYNHVEMMMLIQGSHSTWKNLKKITIPSENLDKSWNFVIVINPGKMVSNLEKMGTRMFDILLWV